MEILSTCDKLRNYIAGAKKKGLKAGLVPTMGALHQGHLALVDTAGKENDLVICSIFVNPTQFNNPEDLTAYPRTLDKDCDKLRQTTCDLVFAPTAEEMYPAPPDLTLDFGHLETVMEGAFRPGHFNGVGIVVAKLFNLVQPDRAYFGQKDLQQTAVIRSLIRNLSYPINLRVCPTVREPDGLAMSSRNVRLLPEERKRAAVIYATLEHCRAELEKGVSVNTALQSARMVLEKQPGFHLEYLELSDMETLFPLDRLQPAGKNALCVAVYVGKVRLIDNLLF